MHMGVNPDESLTIIYDLAGISSTFADLTGELKNDNLRVGIHVQGFISGGSESFIVETPEPATFGLLALGYLWLSRRKRR